MMSGLLLEIVLSVCTCWFHSMVTFPSLACFYWFWYMFIPVFFVQLYPFPCKCWSVIVDTLYHVSLCTVLLPVLGTLILCVLLSHQIDGKVNICYMSLCSVCLLQNILFVTLPLVQALAEHSAKKHK
jgi:hypothetical protein